MDSHTGGEPTRVVISGGPPLGSGPLTERRERFRAQFDAYRRAIVNEPRGGEVWVGALLCPPHDATCSVGVIFFNNVGMLGMCGHGTIGLVATLAHLGRIGAGEHRIDTPVGVVTATLHPDNRVSVQSVPAFRFAQNVEVEVNGLGRVRGDVAWGGNWFYLVPFESHRQELELHRADELSALCLAIKAALAQHGITGKDGAEIDHIELFGPPIETENDARNFVLCPGGAYDRSPCGTGTSAKLACLFADKKMVPGQIWRQESISGSVFEGQIEAVENAVIPTITGRAWVNARATLLLDPDDPLCWGLA